MVECDASERFAEMVTSLKFEDLPADIVELAKRDVMDTLGVMVAASTRSPECRSVMKLLEETAVSRGSSVVTSSMMVPCWMAAFANGAMAHALDYDDILAEARLHAGITTIPAAFATAERVGGVSGKEVITAIALGNEVICRLGLAVSGTHRFDEWVVPPVFGVFSATASAGRILGLDKNQMINAFGIALHQAAGSRELVYATEANLRAIYAGFTGKVGVMSALLALNGITATHNSLEGKAGVFRAYFGGQYDRSRLTADLGKRFESAALGFKLWPSCAASHPYIDAALQLVEETGVSAGDIESITIFTNRISSLLCEPLKERCEPPTVMTAKYSIPFTVALAIARGKVVIGDFTPEGIRDRKVLELASKVRVQRHADLDESANPLVGIVKINTKDGKAREKAVWHVRGHCSEKPMSPEDLEAKFRDCMSYSAKRVSVENVDRLIALISKLEEVADIRDVIRIVAPRQK